ncbi:hypothetical protein SAMN05216206_2537 [Pseudomonas guineae]|uniref:Uncharacterized protein n=1 Tax=Pseudomonas guineae TaxID=425504 RepID=A0A1I3JL51_9PSED|nr:hypothetical protein [Pseudomonas guineae]SFI60997.1 hypothetical protein SAMN05216206_2537 [Pseudomonas guineae]|tara:strand:- start:16061 stop:16234 length:174 start_codon:yes stop_codon:yes gene_type:complete
MSSPISSWEGASTVFTFADKPMVLGFILVVAVALTIFAIYATVRHEQVSYKSPMIKK